MTLGTDISGVADIDWALSTVDGQTALVQAILRRLRTKRGALLGSPMYGYDLRDLIGSDEQASIIAQRVREQVMQEEEVDDCSVDVAFTHGLSTLTVTIKVVAGAGPFTMTVAAHDLTLEAFLDGAFLLKEAT